MNCCRHKYFVIYRGDDTDFPGNQELIVELNTTLDLTGCSAHFSFQGFTQDFTEIPSDKKLRLVIPNSATGKFALGAADAKLWLTNGTKVRTVENRIHIVVTNRVDEAYNNDDPQAITVTISGGGGGATVVLDDTVTAKSTNGVKSSGIWSWVKSLLPSWLTAESEEPRGKTEMRVFEYTWLGHWTSQHPGLADAFNAAGAEPYFSESDRSWYVRNIPDGYQLQFVSSEPESSLHLIFGIRVQDDDDVHSAECTKSATPSKNDKLAYTSATSGIAKFGADGVLEKATEGVDYLKTHQDISGKQDKIMETGVLKGGGAGAILPAIPSSSAGELADYRDPLDNTCHKTEFGEWALTYSDGVDHHFDASTIRYYDGNWHFDGYNAYGDQYDDENATEISTSASFRSDYGYAISATRQRVATKDHAFVTEDNVHSKGVREDGSPADQELHDFFGKSNSLLNTRITYERNATGLKDRAFNALTFDGTEYNLSTALSAVTPTASGQPRDLLIVATATAATTISFTAGTIKGDKPTIDGAGTWLITLTEYAANTWYCRQIKMEDAA